VTNSEPIEVLVLGEEQTRIGLIRIYPPPDGQPACQCVGNPMKAFFCPTGHMMECHVGLDCERARCSHLLRYHDCGFD
jgi:hypothetical protein